MGSFHKYLVRTIWLCLIASFLAVANAQAQNPKLEISFLDKFADKADKVIDVTIDRNLIQLAISALGHRSPDEAKIKELLTPLKGIFVKRYQFENVGEYSNEDAESVRQQLKGPGWQKIANVRSKKEGSFDVVIMSEGSVIQGIAVFAAEPKALTVVNIVGPIDLAKLAELEGRFGIPRFGLEHVTGTNDEDKTRQDKDAKGPDKKPDSNR
jgi:hypothetical protein